VSFDPLIPWDAIRDAGMLKPASFTLSDASTLSIDVGFTQPDEVVSSGRAVSREYLIEFPTADLPDPLLVTRVDVIGLQFRPRGQPRLQGDGTFSKWELTREGVNPCRKLC